MQPRGDKLDTGGGIAGAPHRTRLHGRPPAPHGDPDRIRELYEIKSRNFREAGPARPMPGASRMTAALRLAGLRRVLVTGSGQASLLESIDCDYPGVFQPGNRVTDHDVTHGKPDHEP